MKRDPECDLCRNGVAQDPAAIRAYLKERGRWRDPPRYIHEVAGHVEKYAGSYGHAFMHGGPSPVPLHVLVVFPTRDRPYHVLVTCGMSDLPMRLPDGVDADLCWAELAILLPPDWRLTREALGEGRWEWPLRLLFDIPCYVHGEDAWVWCGHTFGYDGGRIAGDLLFDGVLLHHSAMLGDGFSELDLGGGKGIHFLCLWPLHGAEIDFARREGSHALLERLIEAGATDIVDPGRPSVVGPTGIRR